MSGCFPRKGSKGQRPNAGAEQRLSPPTGSPLASSPPSASFYNLLSSVREKAVDPLREVLRDNEGMSYYEKFLSEEHSLEFLSFWKDIQMFKKAVTASDKKFLSAKIIDTYLTPASPKEVSIPARLCEPVLDKVRAAIESNSEISVDVFDPLQRHAYEVMRADSFVRFIQRCESQRTVVVV